ncbi:hypothetical protein UCRPA7_1350 [Phaeoacremonium minimum UCRPA7]|uniref:Uncharacterized protein n=1 Tax=Phaeoacremonium minimum (strain UCR-PA7) TaxID=1286976 RepID=R8BV08_PHAM7|nr:hypothetical protein UCRPA7_1350 [Phaeoacremonium minimum UCRPA7]EOO03129.1 hypothetical protein UCRPA7_1350 [Phaeoacremonium minimum UCRPA7]
MCEGEITKLLCRHCLVHITKPCGKGCAMPTGTTTELRDTCAQCHPSHRISRINIEFDLLREQALARYRVSASENQTVVAAEIQRLLTKYELQRMEEIRKATIRGVSDEVLWPGKEDDEVC